VVIVSVSLRVSAC